MHMGIDEVFDVLATILDPELGINIVDLGLIYDVQVQDNNVSILMTMTTAACPNASHLVDQAKRVVQNQFPTLLTVDIQLVWEPLWHPLMMSWQAKERLGWT